MVAVVAAPTARCMRCLYVYGTSFAFGIACFPNTWLRIDIHTQQQQQAREIQPNEFTITMTMCIRRAAEQITIPIPFTEQQKKKTQQEYKSNAGCRMAKKRRPFSCRNTLGSCIQIGDARTNENEKSLLLLLNE